MKAESFSLTFVLWDCNCYCCVGFFSFSFSFFTVTSHTASQVDDVTVSGSVVTGTLVNAGNDLLTHSHFRDMVWFSG